MNFDEVWERVCQISNWKKFGDLAGFLEIKSPSVSGAKSRGVFPVEWAFKIGQNFGVSTDWLLTGKGLGGPMPGIDEEFFIRVAFAVESVFRQRKLEISLWQRLRLCIYIYENALLTTGGIDPVMIRRIVSLAATNAMVVEEDSKIQELIERLATLEAHSDNEWVKQIDQLLRKIIENFNDTGLLATLREKERVIAWLERELEKRSEEGKGKEAGGSSEVEV